MSDPDVLRLLAWARNEGAVCRVTEGGPRRLLAATDVAPGESVFTLPVGLLMHHGRALASEFGPGLSLLEQRGLTDRREVLVLFLALERAKGADSYWEPYISSLPPTYTLPFWWSSEQLEHLAGTRLGAAIAVHQKALERLHLEWGPMLREALQASLDVGGLRAVDAALTQDSLLWARSAVWSRAFKVQLEGEAMVALVPVVDLADHYPEAQVGWHTGGPADCFEFVSLDGLGKGTPVPMNYGKKSNEELLLGYGFVLPGNPCDFFPLSMGLGTSSDEDGGETRRAQLVRRGLHGCYLLSEADPLPEGILDACRVCMLPDRAAYRAGGAVPEAVAHRLREGCEPSPSSLSRVWRTEARVLGTLLEQLRSNHRRLSGVQERLRVPTAGPPGLALGTPEGMASEYVRSQLAILQASMSRVEELASDLVRQSGVPPDDSAPSISYGDGSSRPPCSPLEWAAVSGDSSRRGLLGGVTVGEATAVLEAASGSWVGHTRPMRIRIARDLQPGDVILRVDGGSVVRGAGLSVGSTPPFPEADLVLSLVWEARSEAVGALASSPWPQLGHPDVAAALEGSQALDVVMGRLEETEEEFRDLMAPGAWGARWFTCMAEGAREAGGAQGDVERSGAAAAPTFADYCWARDVLDVCGLDVAGSASGTVRVVTPLGAALPDALRGAAYEASMEPGEDHVVIRACCRLPAGSCLQDHQDGLDNETRLLEAPFAVAPVCPDDAVEVAFAPQADDPARDLKVELLSGLGLGTAHYLSLPPDPSGVLAALSVVSADAAALEAAGAVALVQAAGAARDATRDAERAESAGASVSGAISREEAMQQERARALELRKASEAFLSGLLLGDGASGAALLGTARSTLKAILRGLLAELSGGAGEGGDGEAPAVKGRAGSPLVQAARLYRRGQARVIEGWVKHLRRAAGGRTKRPPGKGGGKGKKPRQQQ